VDAWDYYRTVSVGRDLARLETPALVLAAERDPMIPAKSLAGPLREASEYLRFHWSKRGGHLAFPRDLDLGMGAELGLYPQVVGWLHQQLEV